MRFCFQRESEIKILNYDTYCDYSANWKDDVASTRVSIHLLEFRHFNTYEYLPRVPKSAVPTCYILINMQLYKIIICTSLNLIKTVLSGRVRNA